MDEKSKKKNEGDQVDAVESGEDKTAPQQRRSGGAP